MGEDKRLILVEDLFDVFNLWQAGCKNVVALMGTSISDEQKRLIVEAVGEKGKVALMFDPDEAGEKAAKEVLERLIDKVYLKIIRLKIGLEPDSLSKEEINNLL